MTVLLDTNIVLSHLRDNTLDKAPAEMEFVISVITEAEVLRLPGLGKDELASVEKFISLCKVVNVDSDIARKAAELGRTRKTKLPDLLIAATALHFGLEIMTFDAKDFRRIPGLLLRTKI